MKWFKNMKIAPRLIASFLLIALISSAMAVIAILNLRALHKSDTALYENMLVPLNLMAKMSEAFQAQRVNINSALFMDDAAQIKAELAKIEQMRLDINTYAAEFESAIADDNELLQLYNDFLTARDAYRPLADKAISYIRSGLDTQAIETLSADGPAGAAAAAEMAAIDAMYEAIAEKAHLKSHDNEDQAQSTILMMIIITVCVFIVSAGAGIFIAGIVSKPIIATAECAKALSEGQLDAALDVDTSDETGKLASIINNEVRQAFIKIEKVNAVAQKQSEYQAAEVEKVRENLIKLGNGDLSCNIVVADADEDTQELYDLFKEIARHMNGGLKAIRGYIKEISRVLGEMSKGNLDTGIETEFKGEFAELKDSINAIVTSLNSVLAEINMAADQVQSGTRQVSDGSQQISQGATEQASSIEELTASITQVAAQTRQNAVNANTANELSLKAKNDAVSGNDQMKYMQKAMLDINESSESISKIIKVIDDIAFQTNILALNAAVEAARAGVHGKGFAVVAEEVRNLAAKSADAAKQTTDLIEGSIKKVDAGTKIANSTAAALNNIVTGVEKAVKLVGEIAVASNEQATGIAQINRGIEQLSVVVQTNSATSEQAAAVSEELSGQASMLKEMVNQFKLKVISGYSSVNSALNNTIHAGNKPEFISAESESESEAADGGLAAEHAALTETAQAGEEPKAADEAHIAAEEAIAAEEKTGKKGKASSKRKKQAEKESAEKLEKPAKKLEKPEKKPKSRPNAKQEREHEISENQTSI